MRLDSGTIARLAEDLERCQLEARRTPKVTDLHPAMDLEDAYAVQDAVLNRKVGRGARFVGYKVGLTSCATREEMGVNGPVFGFLVDEFIVPEGGAIKAGNLIYPKAEAAIGFVTKTAIKGPGCHIGTVLAACDFVLPAIEVVDSRYEQCKFDAKSLIADNISAMHFMVGGRIASAQELDLRTIGIVLEKNGVPVAFGAGAAVVGNPAAAVAMLVNHLAMRGRELPSGSLVLSGGITKAVEVRAGDTITLKAQHLGSVGMRFD